MPSAPLVESADGEEKIGGGGCLKRLIDVEEAKGQLLFSVPMTLTNMSYYAVTLVAVMFAGHLGDLELAGSTLGNSWGTVTGIALTEKSTHIRFLVSNTAAGCIIGKGGSTITEFQSKSGARIQLSRNHEFFPGTSDRIIMISGVLNELLKAMELILEKLLSEAEESNDIDSGSKVRLIVPNSSCGGIIGKGGSTIKSFIEDSQADIKISPQEQNYVGLNDRLVTVIGTLDEQMRAIFLIMSKLVEDSHYPQSLNSPFPYAGVNFPGIPGPVGYVIPPVAYNAMNYGSNGIGGKYPNNKGSSSQGAPTRSPAGAHENNSVTFGVADEHIGAVVGRGGRNIMEITQASGARVKISDRGDFMSGTSDRKVTISGTPEAIRSAETMIMQKVSSNSER